jgi:hypothetical protein
MSLERHRSAKPLSFEELYFNTRVEALSNNSTVTLRFIGGDEKGSLKSETVKYGHEYQETLPQEKLRWRGPTAYTKDRRVISSERAS